MTFDPGASKLWIQSQIISVIQDPIHDDKINLTSHQMAMQ